MGKPVCINAFMLLTGIDKHAVTRARGRALAEPPQLYPLTPGTMPAFLDGRNAKKYLAGRAWLLDYAESHADYNTMDGAMLLPAGRKYPLRFVIPHQPIR